MGKKTGTSSIVQPSSPVNRGDQKVEKKTSLKSPQINTNVFPNKITSPLPESHKENTESQDVGTKFSRCQTPKKLSPRKRIKTPSKIVITPSKISRKSTMAPAKVVNAFRSPFKHPVPPSPGKSVLKTSL